MSATQVQAQAQAKSRGGGFWRNALTSIAITLAFVAATAVFAPGIFDYSDLEINPHWADLSVLERVGPAVQVHLAAAVAAFGLGLVQLVGPKGTIPHRLLGWIWVVLMMAAAISSLFIMEINHGFFSFIHILSGLTIVALPMAVYAARRHNVAAHKKGMVNLFFGALVIAGVLAFLPGRVMWAMFFG
jgi:uncharacterized membrane protein